jgi:hypothetical protein
MILLIAGFHAYATDMDIRFLGNPFNRQPEQWMIDVDGTQWMAGCQGRPTVTNVGSTLSIRFKDNSDSWVYINGAHEVSVMDEGKSSTDKPCFIGKRRYPAGSNPLDAIYGQSK